MRGTLTALFPSRDTTLAVVFSSASTRASTASAPIRQAWKYRNRYVLLNFHFQSIIQSYKWNIRKVNPLQSSCAKITHHPNSLNVHGPIFTQRCKFWFSFETVKPFGCTKQFCILQLPIPYWVGLTMVTVTSHVFIHKFQTEHLTFAMGYEKIWAFSWYQNLPKVWKSWKKLD